MYALVVDEVDEDALRWSSQRLQNFCDALPVCSLDLPVTDVDRTTVLSWRWDIDSEEGFSANISLALRRAKQLRIRHLFMDLVSVDQNLGGDALLNEVVAFSDLCQRLPVVVTYDHPSAGTRREWYWTMRRRWILREARALFGNPHAVHHVGYTGRWVEVLQLR